MLEKGWSVFVGRASLQILLLVRKMDSSCKLFLLPLSLVCQIQQGCLEYCCKTWLIIKIWKLIDSNLLFDNIKEISYVLLMHLVYLLRKLLILLKLYMKLFPITIPIYLEPKMCEAPKWSQKFLTIQSRHLYFAY